MFRTQFQRIRIRSVVGSRFKILYKPVVTESGSHDLIEDGLEDIYAFIQSNTPGTDIKEMIARFTRGDTSVFQTRPAMYGDFTEFPKTYAEVQQRIIDAENMFYRLPLDDRAKYNNNPSEFIADIGSEKWQKVVGVWKDPVSQIPDEITDQVEVPKNPIPGGDLVVS